MNNNFKISENLNIYEVEKFIELYKIKRNNKETILIEFIDNDSKSTGEVDALFLGYLLLFVEEDDREFHIVFSEKIPEGRIFSLQLQLEHLLFILNANGRNKKNVKLYREKVDTTTGEIDYSRNYIRKAKIYQSQRFIPPIFIDNNVEMYFDSFHRTNKLNILFELYFSKTLEEIKEFTNLTEEQSKKEFGMSEFSFVELCLFRLLITEKLLKSEKLTKEVIFNNIHQIHFFKKYCQNLSSGIRELAQNFVHSSTKKGVISARIYEKNRLQLLKDLDKNYINEFNENDFFLDINVVDLGEKSIREKYIENISKNKVDFSEIKNIKIDFDKDIENISNKVNFKFEDFFIPNGKTEHQNNKLISRYGLQYLTHIISRRFSGYVQAISHSEKLILFEKNNNLEIKNIIDTYRLGTSYNCIIPILKFKDYYNKIDSSITTPIQKNAPLENTLSSLEKYKIVLKSSKEYLTDNSIILFDEIAKRDIIEVDKYQYIFKIYCQFYELNKNQWNNIYLLDANEIPISDPSEWLRLLSAISIDFKNLIIYNIPKETTCKIIELRRLQYIKDIFDFWSDESFVLFYSKQEKGTNEIDRFGANLLSGKNELKYNFINSLVGKNHYSFYEGFLFEKNNMLEIEEFDIKSILFQNGFLKYFELLIKNKDKYGSYISLFEQSLKYSLNKDLIQNLDLETNNKGYKITNTHFRLGSKIHIKDFYYAKRLFQNSFFTTPLAYILAGFISDFIQEKHDLNEITLIGYENYSDFLVSTVNGFLEKRFPQKIINHATFVNDKELTRPVETINKYIFLIVPIASSFSTSKKIQSEIRSILDRSEDLKLKKYEFVEPHINLILVGDENFENKIDILRIDESGFIKFDDETLDEYGWDSINREKKEIRIRAFSGSSKVNTSEIINQKYFIPVYTKWYKSNSCELCFPASIRNEECLVETGFASITPRLIFGLPKVKTNKNPENILNLDGTLLYGNLKKNNNNYLYFARVDDILNIKINDEFINKNKIIIWLKQLRKSKFEVPNLKNKKIVLVTPSSGSKSNFIDLVNEYVFDFTANCLTIGLRDEYIENTESLFADGLYKADIIIYVDDVLDTINSFVEINYIVKYIRSKLVFGRSIDYCISLINRMTYDREENVILKLVPLINDDTNNIILKIEETKNLIANNNPENYGVPQ